MTKGENATTRKEGPLTRLSTNSGLFTPNWEVIGKKGNVSKKN